MNIAIDISPLSSGHSGRGVGVYTRLLVDSLQRFAPEHRYMMVTNSQTIPSDADIIHYPYFDPFFLTLPMIKNKPTVVTVHDVIPLIFPDKFPKGVKGGLKWLLQKQSMKSAKRIITDSDTSKQDIVRISGISSEKIDRIYLGPSVTVKTKPAVAEFSAYRKKNMIPQKYLLYVGDVNWNKNVDGIINAFLPVSEEFPDISLLLVGKSFLDKTIPEVVNIHSEIEKHHMTGRIYMTGFIDEFYLGSIYEAALGLLAPSHYEGFGFSVIDAMYNGCPAMVADSSSLSEIAGPSIRVNPADMESMKGGMKTLLSMTGNERKDMVQKGAAWVKRFTWEKTAKQTIESYAKALL